MNYKTKNLLIENGILMNSKFKFHLNFRKIFFSVYSIWVLCSLIIAGTHPHKYSAYFTDLPSQINIPPFILSLVYLILFVPAIASVLLFVIWVLLSVVLKRLE
jgi:hypothetical protein